MTVGGLPIETPNDEADYDRFVLWEAMHVLSPVGATALRYWGRQFAGGLDFVKLPTDRDWPAKRGFRDAEYRFTMDDLSVSKLRAVGHKQHCTLFAVMLALFNILIYSYTRQQITAVTSPVSVRSQLGFEDQVGDLSNFFLLRAHIDERQDFAALLQQVRQTVIDAMEHRDFPISLVTKRIQVRGLPEGAVPFPLRFNMPRAHLMKGEMAESREGEPRLTAALKAFRAELEFVDRRVTGSSELNLGFFESQRGLLGSIQYNVELFDEGTISQMVARFSHLAAIVGDRTSVSIRDLVASCNYATA
jgi:non-ribosomal peptide synthetase component F